MANLSISHTVTCVGHSFQLAFSDLKFHSTSHISHITCIPLIIKVHMMGSTKNDLHMYKSCQTHIVYVCVCVCKDVHNYTITNWTIQKNVVKMGWFEMQGLSHFRLFHIVWDGYYYYTFLCRLTICEKLNLRMVRIKTDSPIVNWWHGFNDVHWLIKEH